MHEFEISGPPIPWKAHAGYGKRSFNPRFVEKQYYQHEIKKQYSNNLPLTVAVKFDYTFYMPIPASATAKMHEMMKEGKLKHIKRPDVTNLVKMCEDCFKHIVIKDDSQVFEYCARKLYDEKPRTVVVISAA
jgi:Holliday junction resolvase RusA-like endonuclease